MPYDATVSRHPYRDLLARYLLPHWLQALWLGVVLLATIGLQLVNPQIIRSYIDTARHGGALQALSLAALAYIGVAVAVQLVTVMETYVAENLGWVATNRLREDLARHCLGLDMTFHNVHTPGEMIERLDGDVTQLANYFSRFVVYVVGNVIMLAGVLILLYTIQWQVGLAFTCFAVAAMLLMRRVQSFSVPFSKMSRQASAELYGFIEERISGTEDIRANGGSPYTMLRLGKALRQHMRSTRKAMVLGTVAGALFFPFWGLVNVLTFGLGSHFVVAGAMTIGTIYLVYSYTQILLQPIRMINDHLQDFQTAGASMARIDELLSTRSRIDAGGQVPLPAGPVSVELRDVTFGYGEAEPVICDLSFTLQAGEVLGLLGRTGSGKTSITRLLARLYDPRSGTVSLGGVDVRETPLVAGGGAAGLRGRVGLVTQDVQLFGATIRDNLTFFDSAVPDERLLHVLNDLGLGQWYRSLPDGLDTRLGSGGAGLSAGEAQLLAFARVFLQNPSLVILDEASSRLDPVTERLMEQAVDRLLEGRTAVVVAHRLSTVQRADRIMILEAGRIVEQGERILLARDPHSRFAHLLRTGAEGLLA